MAQQKFCRECSQRHKCRDVYRQLGKAEGPSVVFKVLAAFLLPILIFIASLATFERILTRTTDIKELQILLGFLLTSSVTFAGVLIIKAINKKLSKNK